MVSAVLAFATPAVGLLSGLVAWRQWRLNASMNQPLLTPTVSLIGQPAGGGIDDLVVRASITNTSPSLSARQVIVETRLISRPGLGVDGFARESVPTILPGATVELDLPGNPRASDLIAKFCRVEFYLSSLDHRGAKVRSHCVITTVDLMGDAVRKGAGHSG